MSGFDVLNIAVPGINIPGKWEFPKDICQDFILTKTYEGIPAVVPVVPARLIMSEEERHGNPYGANKMVQSGPVMILDLESKNNPSNLTTILDFQEYNQVRILKGERAEYPIKDHDAYEYDPTPIAVLENLTRTYTIFKDGVPYRSVEWLTINDPTPETLHYRPMDKKLNFGDPERIWTGIDNQMAVNYREKKGDRPQYIRVPKFSLDLRETALSRFRDMYSEDRELTGMDVIRQQFPEWDSLSEAQKKTDPFEELVELIRPCNIYDDLTDAEYRQAVKQCLTGVLVGSASRQDRPTRVDMFPILIGQQGTGKTTFCTYLSADITSLDTFIKSLTERSQFKGEIERAASDTSGNRHADNRFWERSSTKIITEFPEGNVIRESTINTFKMLADRTTAVYPRLYENEHEEPITTTFWITTNEENPLFDGTGNRRFFPIQFGGNRKRPNKIAALFSQRSNREEFELEMAKLFDLLYRIRAHARHLADEGTVPNDYWTADFIDVQEKVNSQIVTINPMDVKIAEIIRDRTPEIIRTHEASICKDMVWYAPTKEVEAAVLEICSREIINSQSPDFTRSFKKIWNNRTKYGLYKDPEGEGGLPMWSKKLGKSVRMICAINPDGTYRTDGYI